MTIARTGIAPTLSLMAALATATASTAAPVSLTATGSTYTQDFTTLSKTVASTALPTGWAIAETGTSANASYTPNAGALGSLQSATLMPMFGVGFSNDTGVTLDSLQIAHSR